MPAHQWDHSAFESQRRTFEGQQLARMLQKQERELRQKLEAGSR